MSEDHTDHTAGREALKQLIRQATGEAWMMCSDCGAKLWSFDGYQDASRKCPYQRGGVCEPPEERR